MAVCKEIGKRCLAVLLIVAMLSALCLFAGCGKDQVTVTFDTGGGTEIAAQTIKRGETATEPQAPEKAGYVFAGWFCDGEEWSFTDCSVTEDVTLTARWETTHVTVFGNTVTGLSAAGKTLADIDITPTVGGYAITKIERCAFWNCKNIESVAIPYTMTQIGGGAFEGCSALKAVYITDLAGWCGVLFVDAEANPLTHAHNLYHNGALLTDLVVPDGVTTIGRWAFYDCKHLTSVTMPNGVTEIGQNAFSKCTALTSATVSDSVVEIGESAFANCTALTTVTIGSGVKRITGYAFTGCTGLSSVYYAGDVAGWCKIAFDSVYGNPLYNAHDLYIGGERVTALTIPDGVYKIGPDAFAGCTSLTSVTLGRDVRNIDECAFLGCSGITSVAIGSDVRSIGNLAFYKCTGLTNVTIGSRVTQIGSRAFAECSNLTDMTFTGTVAQWNAIEKGTDWDALTGNYTVHCTDGDVAKTA